MTKAYGTQRPQTIYLRDYQAPAYLIESIDLVFDVHDDFTMVKSNLVVTREDEIAENLFLDGVELELLQIKLNGNPLGKDEYQQHEHGIELHNLPETANIEIETRIYPNKNTSLMGLYQSSGNLCSQCEPEGFRKITYFLDRPDVLSVYTTTIIADREKFPILLSNGNPIEQGTQNNKRHWAKWHDPHPKPSYLFALVAGDLVALEDEFTTQSGNLVKLFIYTQQHNHDKCDHAMASLKNAMSWDEKVYGCEYDLDVYNIVAVDDFNMGAMENKGLNIFNSKYVLAKPETATDSDYQGIEGVIGHEYFHNWSGNRVTCRDWFQLSLKEGFTVFRDQEFSADMGSRGVKRIEDVNILRSHQFREDAGPMSHPVRPASYVEINNFYTLTVYNKGAEVIRMLHHLLGEQGFRKGTDLYFQRHDGQAVTTDDFVKALEDANSIDLGQFKNWYKQAGTPEISVQQFYDEKNQTFKLRIEQSCKNANEPFQIPIAVGLMDQQGKDMRVSLQGGESSTHHVLNLYQAQQEFLFQGVKEAPSPSLLRGFSAPVKVNFERSEEELAFSMAHDNDAFNRWDAGQQLAIKLILNMVKQLQKSESTQLSSSLITAFKLILQSKNQDNAMMAECLCLPSQAYLTEFMTTIDANNLHRAWRLTRQEIAKNLKDEFLYAYEQLNTQSDYDINAEAIGSRYLKNVCLSYLMESQDPDIIKLCLTQFNHANNMTDVMAALSALNHYPGDERQLCLDQFYEKWKKEALVVDKWLSLQATSYLDNTLDRVKRLTQHESFSIKNPNKVRSLIGAFCGHNHAQFHCVTGQSYEFLADNIISIDNLNPQIAARLSTPFTQWRRYQDDLQNKMEIQMQRILAVKGLSKDVYEIISKSLA